MCLRENLSPIFESLPWVFGFVFTLYSISICISGLLEDCGEWLASLTLNSDRIRGFEDC